MLARRGTFLLGALTLAVAATATPARGASPAPRAAVRAELRAGGPPEYHATAPALAAPHRRIADGGDSSRRAPVDAPAAAAAAITTPRPTPSRPATDSQPEAVIVEVRLGDLVARTTDAYRVGDAVLLPVIALLELAEIRFRQRGDGAIEATLQPGDVPLVVDAARGEAHIGRRRLVLARGTVLLRDGVPYLTTAVLDSLLGVRSIVEWRDLLVLIPDPAALPIGQRTAREAARAALRDHAAAQERPADRILPLERPTWDGLVLDYALSVPATRPRDGAYSLAFGADVFGGSLEGSVAGGGGRDAPRAAGSWTGVWRDNPWLRHLRVGDGIGSGPRPRPSRGVSLTNAPYLRPSIFATADYRGQLTPGWEIEAYHGGRLLAVDSAGAGGAFAVNVPVQYGDNPVDFVAYGPFGEVRRFHANYLVLGELLPAGHFEYGASYGRCTFGTPCASAGNVDLRYGLSRRWTVRAGSEHAVSDSSRSATHPYVTLAGNPVGALGVQLEGVAGALARGGVSYSPSVDARVVAEYTRFAGDGAPPLLVPPGRRAQALLSGFVRPSARVSQLLVEGAADHVANDAGSSQRVRLGASYQAREVRYLPYVRLEREAPVETPSTVRPFVGVDAFVLPRATWGSLLASTTLRATLEAESRGRLAQAGLFVTRPLVYGTRIDVGSTWARGGRAPFWSVVVSRDLATLRSYSSITGSGAGQASASQAVQGSVVWNRPARGVSLVPGPSVQRAGLTGRVFLDVDGDGRFGAGDELLPNVGVRVGSSGGLTDARGWFRVWDVVPFQPVLVTVDSMSLASPLWVAAAAGISVEPGPNRYEPLDIPILPGGMVDGRVVRRDRNGRGGAGGVRVLFTDRRTGTVRTVESFTDGDFSAMAIRPGDYDVEVDPAVLTRLDAIATRARVTIAPSPDGATVDGVELAIYSRTPVDVPSLAPIMAAPPRVAASRTGRP